MSWIVLKDVTKRFGKVIAVNKVNLSIEKGEFFTLLGPSGCGKTTTLRLIAGLEIPDEGKIYISGKDVTFLPPGKRNVAMVFQNYALYPHMTVYQNIAYPLSVRKVPRDEIDERVNFVSRNLQISSLLDRKPMEISGGQQQRVALARAIIQRPTVFLLDEPLSNLDAKLRIEARSFLKRLHMELESTIVYVTHDQSEAMALSSRIAIMDAGIIRQVGSPKEVYDFPRDTFVASFLGNPPMNLLKVEFEGGNVYLEGQRLDVKDVVSKLREVPENDLTLGIRPEHVKICKGCDVGIDSEVYVVEPLGAHTVVTVKVGEQFLKVLTFEEGDLSPGERIKIDFRKEKVHFFNDRGMRIEREDDGIRRSAQDR